MDYASLYKKVDDMTTAELDALPMGIIQLDEHGKILHFNNYEAELSKLSKDSVLGRNFFREVAPCTDVQEFHGRFKQGVAEKSLHVKFRYHFAFKQDPRNVLVTLFYSNITSSVWVLVQPVD